MQRRAPTLDHDGTPTVEGDGGCAAIVELALDDDPALVGNEPGSRQRRSGLPVERERIGMRKGGGGAREPLTVQLDRAGGTSNQSAVTGE
jgi:hypothetical protein